MVLSLTDVYGIDAQSIKPLPDQPVIEKSGQSADVNAASNPGALYLVALIALLFGVRVLYEAAK